MTEPVQTPATELRQVLDIEAMREWVEARRWYASKSRHVAGIEVEESIVISDQPALLIALVQTRFTTGAHELYQLPLGFRPSDELTGGQTRIVSAADWTIFDALSDPDLPRELLARIDGDAEIETSDGCLRFRHTDIGLSAGEQPPVRVLGGEQSNTSLVFGENLVLKAFRRVEPGINPELEMVRFLTLKGFPNIAPLYGWYEYEGRSFAATLGVAQEFFPEAVDGWKLALDEIVTDPDRFIGRLGDLGTVTAQMHTVLASDIGDPAFAPEEPSQESLALLSASVDEDVERLFLRLPDDDRLAAIAGRGQDVREKMSQRAHLAVGGKAIRTHGDYHLGQTLATGRGWVIIDFEGEPARPLTERRQKRSPLRDVAGMLRSFAYATSAVVLQRGAEPPPDFEQRARDAYLQAYFAAVDPSLLPPGEAAIRNLLTVLELEKVIYELRYELDNRPDWVSIPVAGIERLLEAE